MFNNTVSPWKFFRPWALKDWSFMGIKFPSGETFEKEEHVAWKEAVLDTIAYMFWARKGDVISLINMIQETNYQSRFHDMRLFTPVPKKNMLVRRGIKTELFVNPFDTTVRMRGLPYNCATTHKSEYFGERDDLLQG
jgi:hypothetical protein